MRDIVICAIPADADHKAITTSIQQMFAQVQVHVPGLVLRAYPQFDHRPGDA